MRKRVYQALAATGIPVAHVAFAKGKAPALPWMVYIQGASDGFYADNGTYREQSEFVVELYQMPTSRETEEKIEAAITAEFGGFSREEEIWIEDEGVIETVYRFTVTDTDNE